MRLWGYYVFHTVVNSIRKLFRTWMAVLLAVSVAVGLIFGLGIGLFMSAIDGDPGSYSEAEELPPEEEDVEPVDLQEMAGIIEVIAGGIVLFILLTSVYTGDKSGNQIFSMADVNFLFTAPLRPQSVLLFRVLQKMGASLLASVYLLFQLPNLILNLGLGWQEALSLILCWVLTLCAGRLLAVLTYTLAATHKKIRRWIRPGILGLVGVLCAAVVAQSRLADVSWWTALSNLFGPGASRYVPLWGWLKGMVGLALEGRGVLLALCVAGIVAALALLVFVTWRIKADFYEDALEHAAQMQEAIAAAGEGRNVKRKKDRSERLQRDGLRRGLGASAFLYKGIYNHHRFAQLRVFTKTGVTYFGVFIIAALATRFFGDAESAANLLAIPAAMVTVIAFFRNWGNPVEMDMSTGYLVMVPETSFKKLGYAMLAGSYDTLMDVLPGLLIATLVLGAPVSEAAGWLLFILTLDWLASSVGLLLEMLLPSSLPQQLSAMLNLSLKLLLMLLPAVGLAVGWILAGKVVGLWIAAVLQGILGLLCFIPGQALLHEGQS